MMQFNPEIRFSSDEEPWLCFRHAVVCAMVGKDVKTTIDEFGSECDMRQTWCEPCSREAQENIKLTPKNWPKP